MTSYLIITYYISQNIQVIIICSLQMDHNILSNYLQEFLDNVNLIKKTLNEDQYEQQILTPSFNRCNQLSESISELFKKGKFSPGQKLKIQKEQKDFKRILGIYLAQIQKHKRMMERDLDYHRESYRKSFSRKQQHEESMRKKSVSVGSSDEDNNETRIELIEINPDLLFQGQMIQQKTKELMAISNQINNVTQIQKEIALLIDQQGQKLDICQDNINQANKNVKDAVQNLQDAKEHHKSATKKKIIIVAIILGVVLAIFIPIGIKFF